MAASGSGATRGRGKWTLVDEEGNIQGSDSDTGSGSSSSSDCVAMKEDAVHFHSKRASSRGSSPASSPVGSPKDVPAERPPAGQAENAASSPGSWLGSLWTTSSKTQPANLPQTPSDEGEPELVQAASQGHEAEDDLDTDSMESIEVIPMPCESLSEGEDHGIETLNFDLSPSDDWPQTGSGAVQPLSSTNALTPLESLSPICSQVEDITSSSNSSQLGFLLLDQPGKMNGSARVSPSPEAMEELEGAVGGAIGGDADAINLHNSDIGERVIGRTGNLPMMPPGELSLSAVSVDNIPRGLQSGGSPRRAQSTGCLPKESTDAGVGVPIMTQRWPTEDGGFLLVQQFRGDGEPATPLGTGDTEPPMSRSSSFSDLSSSFSYPGVRRRIPASSGSSLRHQSSDASSEDLDSSSPYGETSNDELPANMTMSRVTPGIRQYLHRRDESLNSKLTLAALLVITAAISLVVGHYIGSTQATTHHLGIEAGQVWRLRSLQDQLVTCLDKTKALLKGTKGAHCKPPRVTSEPDSKPEPSGPAKMTDHFLPEDFGDKLPSIIDPVTSCSMCSTPDHPETRYSEFCNTKCKEADLGLGIPQGKEIYHTISTDEKGSEVEEVALADVTFEDLAGPSIKEDMVERFEQGDIQSRVEKEKTFDWLERNEIGEKIMNIEGESGDISYQSETKEGDRGDRDELNERGLEEPVLDLSHAAESETSQIFEEKIVVVVGSDDRLAEGQMKGKQSAVRVNQDPEQGDKILTLDPSDALKEDQASSSKQNTKEEREKLSEDSSGDSNKGPNKDTPLMWILSSQISKSWTAFRNLTSDLVGSASNFSVNNVTTHLKENVESLRHQIKDAVSNLQKSNITAHFRDNAQTLGENLKDAVTTIGNSNFSSAVKEAVQDIGEQFKGAVSEIKQANLTSHIKKGLADIGRHIQGAASTIKEKSKKPLKQTMKAVKDFVKGKGKWKTKEKSHSKHEGEERRKHKEQKRNHEEKKRRNKQNSDGEEFEFSDLGSKTESKANLNKINNNLKERNKIKKNSQQKEDKEKKKLDTGVKKDKHKEESEKVAERTKDQNRRSDKKRKDEIKKKHSKKEKEFVNSVRHEERNSFPNKQKLSHKEMQIQDSSSTHDNGVRSQTDKHGKNRETGRDLKKEPKGKRKQKSGRTRERFQNANLDELFESFDVRCHGVRDCLRKQREAAVKLYQELLHYQDWLTERCYKKHLEELEDFMEELEEFLAEPSVTDKDLMELMEDFEDMAEDLEEATTKSFRKFMKKGWSALSEPLSLGQHNSWTAQDQKHAGDDDKEGEETLTVILDLMQIFNLSQSLDDETVSNKESNKPKEERKHAGYGFQSNDDWFIRRMHSREDLRHEHEVRDSETYKNAGNSGDWYEKWMKGREEERSKMTVWDLYQWFSKRQALRHEWRLHEMDDQSNWFLRRP